MLELTDGLKALLKETAERLKGHERRRFMAQTVEELGIREYIKLGSSLLNKQWLM